MDADRIKHLEFIQGVVTRLATNSFALKGWTVTLNAGLFALAADKANPKFIIIALLPILVFWGLDAYYLGEERLYRALHDRTRSQAGATDFAMAVESLGLGRWFGAAVSTTLLAFYLPLTAVLGAAFTALYLSS